MDCPQAAFTPQPALPASPEEQGTEAAYVPQRGTNTAHVNVAMASPPVNRFKWLRRRRAAASLCCHKKGFPGTSGSTAP